MRIIIKQGIVGCILFLLAGCGGDSDSTTRSDGSGSTGSSSSGVQLEELPIEYAAAFCDWIYRCCPDEQRAHFAQAPLNFYGNSPEECETNNTALLLFLVPEITAGEGQGRIEYSPSAARDCISDLRQSCESPEEQCQAIFEPLVVEGGACSQPGQCTTRTCVGNDDEVDGICVAPQPLGGACMEDDECISDNCVDSVCAELPGNGEGCFGDDNCQSNYCDYATNTCADAPYDACEL